MIHLVSSGLESVVQEPKDLVRSGKYYHWVEQSIFITLPHPGVVYLICIILC